MSKTQTLLLAAVSAACTLVAGCKGGGVDSDAAAEAAYYGLDGAIAKALQLGFDGFNAASSANIPPQSTTGDQTGTLDVTGQVDQGASDNKGMRLYVALTEYQDLPPDDTNLDVTYDTDPTALPYLELSLRNIPNGTLTGSLTGDIDMTGEIDGLVTLSLTFDGEIEQDPADASRTRRKPGTTHVVGTATSRYGTYDVDVTI